MALDLHERSLPQVFTAGVSVDHLTWWFWIKAGMGFTLGVAIVSIAGAIVANVLLGTLIYRFLLR